MENLKKQLDLEVLNNAIKKTTIKTIFPMDKWAMVLFPESDVYEDGVDCDVDLFREITTKFIKDHFKIDEEICIYFNLDNVEIYTGINAFTGKCYGWISYEELITINDVIKGGMSLLRTDYKLSEDLKMFLYSNVKPFERKGSLYEFTCDNVCKNVKDNYSLCLTEDEISLLDYFSQCNVFSFVVDYDEIPLDLDMVFASGDFGLDDM